MLDFNLEYYRAFYYVAKLHSFTKAAEALYISQPAVSQSIRKLEQHLNCALFIRGQRDLNVTEEGQALFQHVSAAFDQLLLGEQEVSHSLDYSRKAIRISATETPLHMVVFPAMELFRTRYPGTSILLTGGGSAKSSADDLNSGVADIAMGVTPSFPTEGFVVYEGSCVDSIAAARPDYPLPDSPLTARQLSAQTLICACKGTSARAQLDLWFIEQGILTEPAYSVQTTSTIMSLAEKGLGIGILPAYFARDSISQGMLVEVALEKPLPPRKILVAHCADIMNRPICKQFIKVLLELGFITKYTG